MKILKFAAIPLLVFGTIAANDVAPSNSELEAMYDKAYRAFDAANYVQALKELDAIDARKPDLAASQNLRGVVYMRQGLYDKAEAALAEVRGLDPKLWNARFNLVELAFLKKEWTEERAGKTKAVAKTAFEQALQAYEQRDFDSAARLAGEADTAEPNQPQVLNLSGAILLEQQKYDEAERFFKEALKVDPKFREAQFNLADVPFRNKDYAKARDRFQALLKQTPGGDKNQAAQLSIFRIYLTYLS